MTPQSLVQKPRNDKAMKASKPTVFCWRRLPEESSIELSIRRLGIKLSKLLNYGY